MADRLSTRTRLLLEAQTFRQLANRCKDADLSLQLERLADEFEMLSKTSMADDDPLLQPDRRVTIRPTKNV